MSAQYFVYLFFIYGLIGISRSISVINLNFKHNLTAQAGLGWPPAVRVALGNEALIKLRNSVDNQVSCTVTSPKGFSFDIIRTPPSNKYQKWTDGCGVRIRDVKFEDLGRWRLTSQRGDNSLTGWTELHVLDKTTKQEDSTISLQDGAKQAKVELSSLDNAYCVVAKPFSDSSLIPGNCSVTLDRTTRAVQGKWQVYLGLPGKVSEIQTEREVVVQNPNVPKAILDNITAPDDHQLIFHSSIIVIAERLDVGYMHDANNKLHLYCNIIHSSKDITFCRFQRVSNPYGFNVIDGLSDGSHSYYGEGFALKQCGMTIENPSARDYGSWRCSVGVQMMVGNVMQPQTPMQALISITYPRTLRAESIDGTESSTVFVTKDAPFTISCHAKVSLTYCWFQHPNGTQYTPIATEDHEQLFWYTGNSLELGDCGITFAHANTSDSGEWTCYMGPRGTAGVELTDKVQVRVTGPLASNRETVPVKIGDTVTLYCHTANGRRPLNYCRFLSPTLLGISIDETVTKENAILDRFYFTPNRSLNIGDCSLNIISVHEDDIGEWTCAAVIDDTILESRDTITVYIGGPRESAPYQAGIIGMSVGFSVLFLVLVGYVSYKRGWIHSLARIGVRNRPSNSIISDVTVTFNGNNSTLTFNERGRSQTSSSLSSSSSIDETNERTCS